jgi:hypothetical protein
MKSTLVREIQKTILALEEFAIDWEKHFPESERKRSRKRARSPSRRLAQALEMPAQSGGSRAVAPCQTRAQGLADGARMR